jgi:AcrR family transcriptional regulator
MQCPADPHPAAPRRVRGKGITREMVIEAALTLIDRDGLAAVKFRQLAGELGVTTMAPYSHFSSKEDLLTAMTEHALGGLDDRLDAAAAWDEQIRAAMTGLYGVLCRHPGVADLVLARAEGERLDDLRDVLVAVTVSAGLDVTEAEDALRALVSYVFGFVALTRAGRPVTVRRGSPRAFDYGLTMLLDALRQRVTTTQHRDVECGADAQGAPVCR